MTIVRAFGNGLRRVHAAPAVLAGTYLVTLLLTVPLAAAVGGAIEARLGHSLAADQAADGVNYDWWQEFESQASGLERTFAPGIVGFAAPLGNLSRLADADGIPVAVAGAVGVWLLVWTFLAGGILDRYARNRPTRPSGFFSASGVFFFRFLRLGVMAAAAYALLFGVVHGWLLDDLYGRLTRDVAVERSAFLIRAALYVIFALLVAAVAMVFDYAKIRAVVEDRRSMVGALRAAIRFVARRPFATGGLYAMLVALVLLVLAAYAAVAPGVWGPGWSMWRGFLFGQLYIVARLWARLAFYGAQTAFFQGELAHASYAAAPAPVWPESPAAETIGSPTRVP